MLCCYHPSTCMHRQMASISWYTLPSQSSLQKSSETEFEIQTLREIPGYCMVAVLNATRILSHYDTIGWLKTEEPDDDLVSTVSG